MKRRDFIFRASLAGVLVPFANLQACDNGMNRDEQGVPSEDEFELNEVTIDWLQQKMADGSYTSEKITKLYLDRIESIDRNGIKLNSVIEINPDAIDIAKALDTERRNGKLRGPLHGIPVLIKDNIDTADKMMTTAGSLALEGNIASEDAFVVKQLRNAGAVVLGKTNLSEWANFRSTRSVSGWSSRGGQTKNPYVLDRNPCGSSSGSGTAVAANLCAVAIGTETNGSINCPASINGIVGLKPTVGLVSRSGIIPISHTQDTAGPMARTVRDAAIVLSTICATDPNDTASKKRATIDYLSFLKTNALEGKRIGVERTLLKGHEGVDKLFAEAIEKMRASKAVVVEVGLYPQLFPTQLYTQLKNFLFEKWHHGNFVGFIEFDEFTQRLYSAFRSRQVMVQTILELKHQHLVFFLIHLDFIKKDNR